MNALQAGGHSLCNYRETLEREKGGPKTFCLTDSAERLA